VADAGQVAISAGFDFSDVTSGNQDTILEMQPVLVGGILTRWHFRASAQGVGQSFTLVGYIVQVAIV